MTVDLDSLPSTWSAALEGIREHRRAWVGVVCLPGGAATVDQLEAFGAVERLRADRRYVTLTPWGAQALLGVELFEAEEGRDPVWMRSAAVAEIVRQSDGIRSAGIPGMRRLGGIDRLIADDSPKPLPYTDSDGDASGVPIPAPEPVTDEWDNPVGIKTALGDLIPAFRDQDVRAMLRAKARERRKKGKEAKAKKSGGRRAG
jgi:hypothetical protein